LNRKTMCVADASPLFASVVKPRGEG